MGTSFTGKMSKHPPDEVEMVEPQFRSAIGNENILVYGYIRRHCMNVISEICEMCIAFYGPHSSKLIDFERLNNYSFGVHPFVQHVDGNFMIAYDCELGDQFILWSGFLRIDLKTNSVQQLQCFFHGQPFQCESSWGLLPVPDASEEVQEPDDSKGLQLMVSDPLTKEWTEHSPFYREMAKKNENWRPWNAFNDNLWKMFVCDSLYFPNADDEWLEHQPIWSVIQLLSVMYFNYKQKEEMIVPRVQFKDKWNFRDLRIDMYMDALHRIDEEENADKMNAKTGIIEYRRGIRMKAVCYLSVDWGDSYWSVGGWDRNLYLATFEIEKGENSKAAMMRIAFDLAKSQRRAGTQLS